MADWTQPYREGHGHCAEPIAQGDKWHILICRCGLPLGAIKVAVRLRRCPACGATATDAPGLTVEKVVRDPEQEKRIEPDTMVVRLRPVDADSLLAALEWAVNRPALDMGPGLRREGAIEAARRVEAVADLYRRGVRE